VTLRHAWERVCLAIIVGAFAYGTYTHAADFVQIGWWPYDFGPPAFNLFWNLLVFLDAAVVALVVTGWRRCGLGLALAVMLVDVAVNTYAWQVLDFDWFGTAVAFQAALLGLIVGSIGFLWPLDPEDDRQGRPDHHP
jgi:hypothetical protein